MTRQTTADNLVDAIRNLGGSTKKGRQTTADLLDQLETLIGSGATQDIDAAVADAIARVLPDAIAEALVAGGQITDEDINDVFGGDDGNGQG